MTTPSIKSTAYHEAGHAVVAYFVHRRISHVTIIPEKDSYGHMKQGKGPDISSAEWESDNRMRDRLEDCAMIFLGGDAAEYILTHSKRRRPGSTADFHNAVDYLSCICPEPDALGAYVDWLWYCTRNLLRNPCNWAAVETLATELVKQHYIGGRRAHQIIKEAIEDYFQRQITKQKKHNGA